MHALKLKVLLIAMLPVVVSCSGNPYQKNAADGARHAAKSAMQQKRMAYAGPVAPQAEMAMASTGYPMPIVMTAPLPLEPVRDNQQQYEGKVENPV